jgi:crotonobetainyl-CoA:carnitine CoA-transferase CaiB-like acyl-CoA transferase
VISEDHFWTGLTRTLGLDDAAALTFPERLALGNSLTERIAKALAERDRDDVVRELASAGVPASPILSQPEMVSADVFRARGTVADGPDGDAVMQHPLQYRDHPARVPREVPPLVDGPEHIPSWETD